MELDQIPAVRRAIAKADALTEARRDFAFTDLPARIAGLDARQLTARHLLLLFAVKSPFLCGGVRDSASVAQFLWIVSPAFSAEPAARAAFTRRIHRLKYTRAVRAIEAYLDAALMDSPSQVAGAAKRSAIVSFLAGYVHRLAAAYGWGESVILEMPIARLFQYVRLIARDEGAKDSAFFNPSDKARRVALQKWHRDKADRAFQRAQKKKGASLS